MKKEADIKSVSPCIWRFFLNIEVVRTRLRIAKIRVFFHVSIRINCMFSFTHVIAVICLVIIKLGNLFKSTIFIWIA